MGTITEIESSRVFVKVVQYGSFSKAAAALKQPVSTVSRTVSRLETEVGTKLLRRTTRSMNLTPSGQAFFDHCMGAVQILEDARQSLEGRDSTVSGLVRITATEDLGAFVVTPVIGTLMRQYPGLQFEFLYTDEVVDMVKEGYDLAVRIGRLNPSRFKALRLGELSIVAVASPGYLANRPQIKHPDDLSGHDIIAFRPEIAGYQWLLTSKTETVKVPERPRTFGNQMQSLVSIAEQGSGIAFVPQFACRQQLTQGALIRVLPDWSAKGFGVSLVSPAGGHISARLRIVGDRLASSIREVLTS